VKSIGAIGVSIGGSPPHHRCEEGRGRRSARRWGRSYPKSKPHPHPAPIFSAPGLRKGTTHIYDMKNHQIGRTGFLGVFGHDL